MTHAKPVPAIDAESAPYWAGAREGRLMIQRCRRTGQCFLYSRRLVPGAGDGAVDWIEAGGGGEVYSFTVCHAPAGPAFADDTPYAVVCVELDEGARIMSKPRYRRHGFHPHRHAGGGVLQPPSRTIWSFRSSVLPPARFPMSKRLLHYLGVCAAVGVFCGGGLGAEPPAARSEHG